MKNTLLSLLCIGLLIAGCKKSQESVYNQYVDKITKHTWHVQAIYFGHDRILDTVKTACYSNCYLTFSVDSTCVQHYDTTQDSFVCYNTAIINSQYIFYNDGPGNSSYGLLGISDFHMYDHGVYSPFYLLALNDTMLDIKGTDFYEYVFKAQ